MIIIGITGTIGAGKGTVVDYLVSIYQFRHYSARDLLKEEAIKLGLPLNRDSYTIIANTLRQNHSPSFVIDKLFEAAKKNGNNAVIESIRTLGEIQSLRLKEHFLLLSVDAQSELRYQRICLRNSETDKISYQEFLKNEEREISSTDPNKQNLLACIREADEKIINNGNVIELHQQIDKIMQKWLKIF